MSFNLGSFPVFQHPAGKGWSDCIRLGRYSAADGPRLQLCLSVAGPPANLASLTPSQAADLARVLSWWSTNPWYGSDVLAPPVVDSWDRDDWG